MKAFTAGQLRQGPAGYRAFHPQPVNRPFRLDDMDLQALLEQATLKLGELSAFGELVPDIGHFIRMHVVKEATVSSRIEGTRTNMEEALLDEQAVAPERRDDHREVSNYVEAMHHCIERMPSLPLSGRLLREAHAMLLQGVRGEHKMPGEFRRSQNWIGGASLADAAFVPPVWEKVAPLMSDLESLFHDDRTGLPHVLKAALAHYQFETVHPFLDGNGRIGRLMITLYFLHAGVLRQPVLYLSDFFERNRTAYYDNLMRVRQYNDLQQWFRFFLVGVTETADKATNGLRRILRLKQECLTERLPRIGRRTAAAPRLLDHLFKQPIVWAEEVMKATGQSAPSAYKLIADFERIGILRETTGNKWRRLYRFDAYFKVFE